MVIYDRYSFDGRLEGLVEEAEYFDKVFAGIELDGETLIEQEYDYGDTKKADIDQCDAEIMAVSYVIGALKAYEALRRNGFDD